MPRVSVIIPTYNCEDYVQAAIDSVLWQTYTDFEIIVVDDGSTDNTASIVAAMQDKRIRSILKANGGTASARNLGIRNSAGEYLQLLDADDLILPSKLARQIDLLSSNPTIDVVYSSFRYFYHDRCDLYAPTWLRPPSDDPYRELVRGSIFPPHAALVRRERAESIGLFNAELISAEDWDFWIRLARSGSTFLFHDELLALYRQHAANKTKRLARWRHAHVQVMENLRTSAENEQELRRIDWHYYASYNYVLWALALMLEDNEAQTRDALKRAHSLNAYYGHSEDALAKRIAESALARDLRDCDKSLANTPDSSQWLDKLATCFPERQYSENLMRKARSHYWLAKARRAHTQGTGSDVREFLWRALRNGGFESMNLGTLSILTQSIIGRSNWHRLKRGKERYSARL